MGRPNHFYNIHSLIMFLRGQEGATYTVYVNENAFNEFLDWFKQAPKDSEFSKKARGTVSVEHRMEFDTLFPKEEHYYLYKELNKPKQ
jgi:hypothetical protein